MASTHPPASGEQFILAASDSTVVIASLAASLRRYTKNGVEVTETYPDDRIPPGGAGILLAPWANRVDRGRWTLNGREQQLDITEPSKGNASHGLLRNTGYQAIETSEDRVVLQAEIFPQHGYPFHLTHTAAYTLTDRQLTVRQSLTNHSQDAAPFGLGAHPYLKISGVPTEDLVLTVNAEMMLENDERAIPVRSIPVEGALDLRAGRRIGDLTVDTAYSGLAVIDGRVEHTLAAPDGRSVTLWADESFGYAHVFVSRIYPGAPRAVAVEPMTAPANAFNSGQGLRWLESGSTFSAEWGITPALG